MHSSTFLKAGVAAAGKATLLAPFIEFFQDVDDQAVKIALTEIARKHEASLKSLDAAQQVSQQILMKLQLLFQGKGGDAELRELVNFQKNPDNAFFLLPDMFYDDNVREQFLLNVRHAGDSARVIELSEEQDLSLQRPDLVHLLVQDTREKILLCQAPVGFVNMALGWQKDRVQKDRKGHSLAAKPFEGFDFVYDADGVPKADWIKEILGGKRESDEVGGNISSNDLSPTSKIAIWVIFSVAALVSGTFQVMNCNKEAEERAAETVHLDNAVTLADNCFACIDQTLDLIDELPTGEITPTHVEPVAAKLSESLSYADILYATLLSAEGRDISNIPSSQPMQSGPRSIGYEFIEVPPSQHNNVLLANSEVAKNALQLATITMIEDIPIKDIVNDVRVYLYAARARIESTARRLHLRTQELEGTVGDAENLMRSIDVALDLVETSVTNAEMRQELTTAHTRLNSLTDRTDAQNAQLADVGRQLAQLPAAGTNDNLPTNMADIRARITESWNCASSMALGLEFSTELKNIIRTQRAAQVSSTAGSVRESAHRDTTGSTEQQSQSFIDQLQAAIQDSEPLSANAAAALMALNEASKMIDIWRNGTLPDTIRAPLEEVRCYLMMARPRADACLRRIRAQLDALKQ